MKVKCICFLLFLSTYSFAQDDLVLKISPIKTPIDFRSTNEMISPNLDFFGMNSHLKLIAVNTSNPYFQRTYMVDSHGQTVSSGFMPSAYFLPNNNFIVINGSINQGQDSYNPYGSTDFSSMIFLGAINSIITISHSTLFHRKK